MSRDERTFENRPGGMLAVERKHSLMGGAQIAQRVDFVIDAASGSEVFDSFGRRYVDLYTGVGSAILGHGHPVVVEAITRQASQYSGGVLPTAIRAEYLGLLTSTLAPNMSGVRLFSTGSEAVEAAVGLARAVTGRNVVVSFWGGFHGKTHLTAALGGGGSSAASREPVDVIKVPYAACHKCPLALRPETCGFACVELAERTVNECGLGQVAAVLVEPILGTAGNVVPPVGYLAALRALADRLGALLVVDEVITGFGRTGRLFAHQVQDGGESRSLADVMVIAKGMGNGVPISAVVANPALVEHSWLSRAGAASSTFGGNPISVAAALATLQVVLGESIPSQVAAKGKIVGSWLEEVTRRVPLVSRAQNEGLMIGLDLSLPGSNEPLPSHLGDLLFRELKNRGVLAMAYSGTVRLYPALNISISLLREALERFLDALEVVDGFVSGTGGTLTESGR